MYHMKYSHSDDNLSFRGQPDKLQNFEKKKLIELKVDGNLNFLPPVMSV